jgi:hypothetical protein
MRRRMHRQRTTRIIEAAKLAEAVTDRFILVTIVFILANCFLPEHATGLWLNRWFSVFPVSNFFPRFLAMLGLRRKGD